MTQVEVVNDSSRKLPKVPPKDGESIHCGKGIYNSAGSSVEMVSKHEDLTQAEEVNDSGKSCRKYPRKMGRVFISLNAICKGISTFTIARFRSNGKFSIWRLTQAEVVNDNGRKLPKVPQTNGESVHLSVYEHED